MVLDLFRRQRPETDVERLYVSVVGASRRPALFLERGVADTVEGRFESLMLFSVLAVRRLRNETSPELVEFKQAFIDRVFAGLDDGLRELGVSDTSVPKRMKRFAAGYLGRADAYGGALDSGDRAALASALLRNVYGGIAEGASASRLAGDAMTTEAVLTQTALKVFRKGEIAWPAIEK